MTNNLKDWLFSFYGIVDERFAAETDLFRLQICRKEGLKKIEMNSTKGQLIFFIPTDWDIDQYRNQEKLRKIMKAGIKDQAIMIFNERAMKIAERNNIHYSKLTVYSSSGNVLGRCDSYTKHIKFNIWTILILNSKYIDYLICHELAHLFYNGHSKHFWKIVDAIYLGESFETDNTGSVSQQLEREMSSEIGYTIFLFKEWWQISTLKRLYKKGFIEQKKPLIIKSVSNNSCAIFIEKGWFKNRWLTV